MKDALLVEPVTEGILLATLFEPPCVVTAVIRKTDLIKRRVILESLEKMEADRERTR